MWCHECQRPGDSRCDNNNRDPNLNFYLFVELLENESSSVVLFLNNDKFTSAGEIDLLNIVKQKNLSAICPLLVEEIADALYTNLATRILNDEDEISKRNSIFGHNAYKEPPTRSFFFFALNAFKDHEILFLLVYAVISLHLELKIMASRNYFTMKEAYSLPSLHLLLLTQLVTFVNIEGYWSFLVRAVTSMSRLWEAMCAKTNLYVM